MATLYVENLPDELYAALKLRVRAKRTSIAVEVTHLLERHVPSAKQLQQRKLLLRKALKMSSRKPLTRGPFPSAEEMLREDRSR